MTRALRRGGVVGRGRQATPSAGEMAVPGLHSQKTEGSSAQLPTIQRRFFRYRGPRTLAFEAVAFESVCPGAAGRLLDGLTDEQKHRHACETTVLNLRVEDVRLAHKDLERSQWLAFGVCLSLVSFGAAAVYWGHPVIGGLVSGATLAGVITAFLGVRRNKAAGKRERGENDTKRSDF